MLVSPPDAGMTPAEPVDLRAAIAGSCAFSALAPDASPPCPDPGALVDCATAHCGLSTCVGECSDYLSCLKGQPSACTPGNCAMSPACSACTSGMTPCLLGFCEDQVGCGKVTPGGPCSRVEACCRTQGDYTDQCLMLTQEFEKLSGDPSCVGVMTDWDWNTHIPVPCTYGP